ARLFHRTFRGGDRIVDEGVHLLDVFFVEPAERIEVFNFAGDLGGKLSGIEAGDLGNTAACFAEAIPGIFSPRPQRRYQPDAGDHNSSFLQNKTSFYDLGIWDSM